MSWKEAIKKEEDEPRFQVPPTPELNDIESIVLFLDEVIKTKYDHKYSKGYSRKRLLDVLYSVKKALRKLGDVE